MGQYNYHIGPNTGPD